MLSYTHLMLGLIVFLLSHRYFVGGNVFLFGLVLLFGTLFPDIDQPGSKINRSMGFLGSIASFFCTHRGLFHSLFLAIVLFVIISSIWSNYYAFAFLLGFAAHIIGDMMTPAGIRLFYPLAWKIRGPVRTGGMVEAAILVLLVMGLGVYFWRSW